MELFTSTKAISGSIENIVDTATNEVYLVTAYVQLEKQVENELEEWKTLTNRMKVKRKDREVKFIFIVRDEENKEKEKEILRILKDYADQIWLVPNLHSKFYYNGDRLLITSMNLYLHSTKKNPEIGVSFKKPNSSNSADLENFNQMKSQIEDYISLLKQEGRNILSIRSEPEKMELELVRWGKGYSLRASNNQNLGYCIVCGKATPKTDYREGRLVRCRECYDKKQYISDKIKGTRCHICGQEASVNARYPFCQSCKTQISVLKAKNPPIKQNKTLRKS